MAIRNEYQRDELDRDDLADSPFVQLQSWLNDAKDSEAIEPSAMCVSTATCDGRPSSRFVLLRGLDESGLVFFSNYESRKGHEIAENPQVSAAFWWGALERQVRVEGRIERTSAEESDAYFASRPLESQLASAASPQSQVVATRAELEKMVSDLAAKAVDAVTRPDHWGGYRIVPDRFEFWQGRRARLHDRLVYRKADGIWIIERLAP